MQITTRYWNTRPGQGKITATHDRRQATVNYRHADSITTNHRGAAAQLLENLGLLDDDRPIDIHEVDSTSNTRTWQVTGL